MTADYRTQSPEETIALGKKLAGRLQAGDCVLLYGELGSGKTHFIKGIAEGLGIGAIIKSPTYVYVNRYPLPVRLSEKSTQIAHLCHYDLYRLNEGDDLSSIGLDETLADPNAVNVVEWADRMGDTLPDRFVSVSCSAEGKHHTIKIAFVDARLEGEKTTQSFFDEWVTPMHVREHSKQVTNVAMRIAEAFIRKGEIVNLSALYTACMLHDMARVCDFRTLDRNRFEEPVTDEKWKKWVELRERYAGIHHADIAYQILHERGLSDVAELIRLHKSTAIVREPESYSMLEKQIIYYADKRVKHTEIVSLTERFRDGRERYGKFDTLEDHRLFDEVETRTHTIEDQLFSQIDIGPEEVG